MSTPGRYRTARQSNVVAPAAPAGGARRARWGGERGRFAAPASMGALIAVVVAPTPLPAAEPGDRIAVPSGQAVTFHEVLLDQAPGALWARFRFVAPDIGGAVDHDASAADMDHLCAEFALPYLADNGISPARVVISLSDRVVPFGEAAPDATQYFEAYRPEDGRCIWEGF